jgi:hypothetical protein
MRRVTPAQIKAARRYQRTNPAQIDPKALCRELLGHDFIFYRFTPRHAEIFVSEIVCTWEYLRRRAERIPTGDIEVPVIRIGDAAIVGFGCELLCEVKHSLQSASPFAHTFFSSLTNGGHGYVRTHPRGLRSRRV